MDIYRDYRVISSFYIAAITLRSCETKGYVQAVRDHLGTPVVCEQGYGLLANLTLRDLAGH